jgi:hypothetical protein
VADLEPGALFQFGVPAEGAPRTSQPVRDNFTALGQTHYTTDEGYPASPRKGMMRILLDPADSIHRLQWFDGSTWRSMLQRIEGGTPAPVKVIVDVNAAATTWTVDHNLGSKPLVQVFDATWIQRQPISAAPGAGQYVLTHVNDNRFTVTHSGAVTGHVIILG